MRRTLTRGVVVAYLATLGCQVQPAPKPGNGQAPSPVTAAPQPPPAEPEPPVQATPFKGNHYIPPIVAKPPPEVRIPELRRIVWDMGVIPPSTKKGHRFEIKNDSEVTWNVRYVTPDCKCTLGEFSSRSVKPGETTHLEVGFRADVREGHFMGAIAVDFQEVGAPHYMLFLKAEVRRPLAALPATVDFGKVGPVERLTRTFELRNYTEADIAQPTIDVPPWMSVELKPLEKKAEDNRARQTWEVQVHADVGKLKSTADPGMVVVRAGAPREPLLVPLSLKMKAPLEPLPGEVVFENYQPGSAAERTFLLETYPDLGSLTENDLILRHDLGDELTVEVTKKLGTNRFQLVARYRPRAAYASIEGELTISVRERDVPPARIKVRGKYVAGSASDRTR